jgi:cell division protein FtsX
VYVCVFIMHATCICFTGGELPAASAAAIYFVSTAVIPHLSEPAQRKLLSALATATSHAIAPPAIIASLEGCGMLLELLGATVHTVVSCAL